LPPAPQNTACLDTFVTIMHMDMLSLYLYELFQVKIDCFGNGGTGSVEGAASGVFPPNGLSLEAAVDCEQLSTILAKAYVTPSACIVLPLVIIECLFIHTLSQLD